MLTERSELSIKQGQETEFATAMKNRGIALLSAVPGVVSVKHWPRCGESEQVPVAGRVGGHGMRTRHSTRRPPAPSFAR